MRALRWQALAFTLLFPLLILPMSAQEDSWQGPTNGPQLKAQLADKEKNASHRIAVVDVDVRNVTLTDPISYGGGPGMGHLQFRLDNGPYLIPMSDRLVIEGLTPGKHTIEVSLADGSFRPMGAKTELEVQIP